MADSALLRASELIVAGNDGLADFDERVARLVAMIDAEAERTGKPAAEVVKELDAYRD